MRQPPFVPSPPPVRNPKRRPPFDINATATYHLADYFHNYADLAAAQAALDSWGLWDETAGRPNETTMFPDEDFPDEPNTFQGSIVTIAWIPVWMKQVGIEVGTESPIFEQQPGSYSLMRVEGRPIPWPDPLPNGMFLMPLGYSPVEFMGGNVAPPAE